MNPQLKDEVLDIEELAELGTKHGFCPYMYSRERAGDADIIFLPYNYLIDSHIRQSLNMELEGASVIFDEAHNLESE